MIAEQSSLAGRAKAQARFCQALLDPAECSRGGDNFVHEISALKQV